MLLRRLQLRRLQLRRLPSNTYRSNTNSPTRKVGLFLYSTESEKVLERYLHCVEGSNKNICCYETISKICASYHSLLRCRLGSNALPARCPRGVVSLLREAEHHTSECCVPYRVEYNIYMYGSVARPIMGFGHSAISRTMVSATRAQLPMEPNVLLYAVTHFGTYNHTALGRRGT